MASPCFFLFLVEQVPVEHAGSLEAERTRNHYAYVVGCRSVFVLADHLARNPGVAQNRTSSLGVLGITLAASYLEGAGSGSSVEPVRLCFIVPIDFECSRVR